MPAVGRIEGRQPNQPVDAHLGPQEPERERPLDQAGDTLDARRLTGRAGEELELHAAALGPQRVHPLQHLGPVLGLGSAGPGVDRQVGIAEVVLARQQQGVLGPGEVSLDLAQLPRDVIDETVVALELGQLDHLERLSRPPFHA